MKKKCIDGFTLIEIIVVIVILSVLMAVAVPAIMNYIEEADDSICIAEAKSILTSSEKYLTYQYAQKRLDNEAYTGYLTTDEKETVVHDVKGKGTLVSLYYENGVIMNFTYYINEKYVAFLGYNNKFIINETMYTSIADAIIKNDKIKDMMVDYFDKKPNQTIDSEAGTDGFIGTANSINQSLKGLGLDPETISWQIQSVAQKNGKKRYQFLITDQKLTTDMNGQSITATKYIYYEDGTADQTTNNNGEGNFDVKVQCHVQAKTVNGITYPIIYK